MLAVITGASSGIGETFARRLAPSFDLLLIARREDRMKALAAELSATTQSRIDTLSADLTKPEDLKRVAERIETDERLALLVNNAGFGTTGRFWETSLDEQIAMHELHITATLKLTHAALGNLVRKNFGGIINVASVAAFVRTPGSTSYCATKSWMTSFTEGLYLELKQAASNVTVQALCPGYTYSEFHDRLRMDRSRIAPASFWLTSDEVVEASLDGLRDKTLFVIPNWRYRVLTSFLNLLPTSLRLAVEFGSARARQRSLARGQNQPGQLT